MSEKLGIIFDSHCTICSSLQASLMLQWDLMCLQSWWWLVVC